MLLLALCISTVVACEISAPAQQQNGTNNPAATVTGSGTAQFLPIWTGTTTIGNSKLFQTSNGMFGIDTTSPAVALDVNGRINAAKSYRIANIDILSLPVNMSNTAVGVEALKNTTGSNNTGVGYFALQANTSGSNNTAIGLEALEANTTGTDNTADGYAALGASKKASGNTATGSFSLANSTGDDNTGDGYRTLGSNMTGKNNTAIGSDALSENETGSNNIAIGYQAAMNVSISNGNNIHIGNTGTFGDSSTIRIGTSGSQNLFFAAGVRGVTTGSNDAVAVLIDSNGQLGTVSSSARYKEDIRDMGEASQGLMQLRPVTFRYRKAFNDGSKPLQYGLIAEEVGEVYPDLVTRTTDGQVDAVKYQVLDSMLLNELQRQEKVIEELEKRLARMETELSERAR